MTDPAPDRPSPVTWSPARRRRPRDLPLFTLRIRPIGDDRPLRLNVGLCAAVLACVAIWAGVAWWWFGQ